MKKLGVTRIISVGAVGSMKKEISPGDIVIPDQFYDLTKQRKSTFFSQGIVAHVSFADPVCPKLSALLAEAGEKVGARIHQGGVYLCMEGPQFSTRAESRIHRQWGVDIIGMTNVTEAKLAREAEICYSTLALVTDYDCWYEGEESVTVEAVIETLNRNVRLAQEIIRKTLVEIPGERSCSCATALRNALITDPEKIPPQTKKALGTILGK